MARYTGPNNKKARRVSFSILENGKDIAKRPYGPGQHGKDRKRKPSNYAIQLNEKQKARFMYGISEKQFKKLVNDSAKMKGVHGENLLKLLESRLDNVVFRMGLATSRRGSRQIVNHGHILVNGKKVDIPSYRVKVGDVITIRDKSKNSVKFKEILDKTSGRLSPKWLEVNKDEYTAKVIALPSLEDIDYEVAPHLIVELYSK